MTFLDSSKVTDLAKISAEIAPLDNPLTSMSGTSIALNALDALRAETQTTSSKESAQITPFNTSETLQNTLSFLSTMSSNQFAVAVQDLCEHAKDPKEAAKAIETVLDKVLTLPMETREDKERLFEKLADAAYVLGMHQEVLDEIGYEKKVLLVEALALPIKDYERRERDRNMAQNLSGFIGNDPTFQEKDTGFVTNLVQTLKDDEELLNLLENAKSEKTLDSYAACAKRVVECSAEILGIPVPYIETSTDPESEMGIEASFRDYRVSINIPKLIPSNQEGLGYVVDAAIHETRHLYQEMLADNYMHQVWGLDAQRPELQQEALAPDLMQQARHMTLGSLLYTTKGHLNYLSTAMEKDARQFARRVTAEVLGVSQNRDEYPYERMF